MRKRSMLVGVGLVGAAGLEPASLTAEDFKSSAYANSATPPHKHAIILQQLCFLF